MTATPARLAAFRILRAVRGGALADHALEFETRAFPARERAWTQELVYGVLRLRGRLDSIIDRVASREIDTDIRDILRLGTYQLLEMDSVPAYAAVSESVEIAKSVRGRGAGFVNAILQRLVREPAHREPPHADPESIEWLATWGSHPEWLVRRWVERFGGRAARSIVEYDNQRPHTYLFAAAAPTPVRSALSAAGIRVEEVPDVPGSMRLVEGTPLDALAAAPVIVQDPASSLVSRYLSVAPGMIIADLCAAPGGKTAALATSTPVPAYVMACDVAPVRARLVAETIRRLELGAAAVVADARQPPIATVDAVLLDVPCTGTGTLRRHPDARWRLSETDIGRLAVLQTELLEAAARIVRPNGTLVYATCSLEAEENEDQVDAFLARHPEFRTEPPESIDTRYLDGKGWLRIQPHEHGFDGAFAARLRRV